MFYRLLFLLALATLFSNCKKKVDYSSVQIIGHAGAGLHISTTPFHDNSNQAIEYALATEGVAGIEIDIQLSASGTLWLFHDTHLENETSGSGCIASSTDEKLSELHYSTLQHEKIYRLSELDFSFDSHSLFLDVRHFNDCDGISLDLTTIVTAIKNTLSGIPTNTIKTVTGNTDLASLLANEGFQVYLQFSTAQSYLDDDVFQESTGICIKNDEISSEEVSQLRNLGKEVVIFEVRSPSGIRSALNKFPNFLMTDDIKATLIEKYP